MFSQELPLEKRVDVVSNMVYEANARIGVLVFGCVGTIFSLQQQLSLLQAQLVVAQAKAIQLRMHHPNSHVLLGEIKSDMRRDEDHEKNITCQSIWTFS